MTIRDMKASFDCIQQMPLQPTHRDDGTLDLIVTKVEQEVFDIAIDPLDISSDNNIVSWHVPLHHQYPIVLERE